MHRYSAAWTASGDAADLGRLARQVDAQRFRTCAFSRIQEDEARWWRDACLLYPPRRYRCPGGLEPLEGTLEEYVRFQGRYVPGI